MLFLFLQIDLENNSTTWFGTSVPTTQFREEVLQESDDVGTFVSGSFKMTSHVLPLIVAT